MKKNEKTKWKNWIFIQIKKCKAQSGKYTQPEKLILEDAAEDDLLLQLIDLYSPYQQLGNV